MATDDSYLQNLDEWVCYEKKIVTYKWLSNELNVSSNLAKQMLYSFMLSKGDKIKAIYIVSGIRQGAHRITLVSADKLEETKAAYQPVLSVHLYSVQAVLPKDSAELYSTDQHKALELLRNDPLNNPLLDNRHSGIFAHSKERKQALIPLVPLPASPQESPEKENKPAKANAKPSASRGAVLPASTKKGGSAAKPKASGVNSRMMTTFFKPVKKGEADTKPTGHQEESSQEESENQSLANLLNPKSESSQDDDNDSEMADQEEKEAEAKRKAEKEEEERKEKEKAKERKEQEEREKAERQKEEARKAEKKKEAEKKAKEAKKRDENAETKATKQDKAKTTAVKKSEAKIKQPKRVIASDDEEEEEAEAPVTSPKKDEPKKAEPNPRAVPRTDSLDDFDLESFTRHDRKQNEARTRLRKGSKRKRSVDAEEAKEAEEEPKKAQKGRKEEEQDQVVKEEPQKKKRKVVKKEEVQDEDEEPKKKRGRPKKEEKEMAQEKGKDNEKKKGKRKKKEAENNEEEAEEEEAEENVDEDEGEKKKKKGAKKQEEKKPGKAKALDYPVQQLRVPRKRKVTKYVKNEKGYTVCVDAWEEIPEDEIEPAPPVVKKTLSSESEDTLSSDLSKVKEEPSSNDDASSQEASWNTKKSKEEKVSPSKKPKQLDITSFFGRKK